MMHQSAVVTGAIYYTFLLRVCDIGLNACHVLCNAARRVCWRDGAYVNLNRVKLIIERYSSHAAFCNVTASLTCSYVAV